MEASKTANADVKAERHKPTLKERAMNKLAESRTNVKTLKERAKHKIAKDFRKKVAEALVITTILAGSIGGAGYSLKNAVEYDSIQMAESFEKDTPKLEVIVAAVPQKESQNTAYLLNGGTEKDEWYQGGLTFKDGKFCLGYETFDSGQDTTSIFGGAGHADFSKEVKPNDNIRIKLEIDKNHVVSLEATDLDNGATAKRQFKSKGTIFKGDGGWNFTGIMTEIKTKHSFKNSDISTQKYTIVYPKSIQQPVLNLARYSHFPNETKGEMFMQVDRSIDQTYMKPSMNSTVAGLAGMKISTPKSNETYTTGVK